MNAMEDQRVFDQITRNGERLGDCAVWEVRAMIDQYRRELPDHIRREVEQYLKGKHWIEQYALLVELNRRSRN